MTTTPTSTQGCPGRVTTSTPARSPGTDPHVLRRGNKYSAAHYLRTVLANDDRPRTMHAEAEHTPRHPLPDIVGQLLDDNEQRRGARCQIWREHMAAERAREAAYHRITETIQRAHERDQARHASQDYGLEL